jgi:hypothetical protein
MLARGGFSFVALLVINPLVILLYQNSTFSPTGSRELASRNILPQKRFISSVTTTEKVDIHKLIRVTSPTVADCHGKLGNCAISEVE